MEINRLSGLDIRPLSTAVEKAVGEDGKFAGILDSLINPVVESDAADKVTNYGLMVGEVQNTHNLTIAAEKADIALRLTIQIRNKAVEAYKEILGMQV